MKKLVASLIAAAFCAKSPYTSSKMKPRPSVSVRLVRPRSTNSGPLSVSGNAIAFCR